MIRKVMTWWNLDFNVMSNYILIAFGVNILLQDIYQQKAINWLMLHLLQPYEQFNIHFVRFECCNYTGINVYTDYRTIITHDTENDWKIKFVAYFRSLSIFIQLCNNPTDSLKILIVNYIHIK